MCAFQSVSVFAHAAQTYLLCCVRVYDCLLPLPSIPNLKTVGVYLIRRQCSKENAR